MNRVDPKVSIVIPVYNGANFLAEAIDSALAQTYPNLEILVINDGSTDGGKTESIALSYGDRIRYIAKPNGGVATALNRGIEEMTGDYFSWLSHDDLYYPTKTEEQARFMAEAGGECIVFGDFEYIDQEGRSLGINRVEAAQKRGIKFSLIMQGTINGCTVLIPRKCFDVVGLFDPALKTTQDFDMWFRLANRFSFRYHPKALVKSRVHPGQGSLTIPGHLVEQNALYLKAIDEFSPEDLVAGSGETMASFYAGAAIRFASIGCDEAAGAAADKFRGAFLKDGALALPRNIMLFATYSAVRTVYRNEAAKKLVKKINRLISR